MSASQTTQPAQRIALSVASGPNPPWTNKYFVCACGAKYQLGCSDECEEVDRGVDALWIKTSPCWTCGKVNVIKIPRDEPERNPS
jgi:hypothetical protein